jgi:hypothetical protein
MWILCRRCKYSREPSWHEDQKPDPNLVAWSLYGVDTDAPPAQGTAQYVAENWKPSGSRINLFYRIHACPYPAHLNPHWHSTWIAFDKHTTQISRGELQLECRHECWLRTIKARVKRGVPISRRWTTLVVSLSTMGDGVRPIQVAAQAANTVRSTGGIPI